LEIDILAITESRIYIIEVKNWNREYFNLHKTEILEQQEYREETIPAHFNEKKVNYIICFSNREIGINFNEFLADIGKPEILVAHYEEEIGELANIFPTNNIKRIDKLIEGLEKEFKI
jgi:Nuclease-related domain